MLKVLSLSVSLPQSTSNTLRPFRIIFSPLDLHYYSQELIQVRLVSDFAARWPEPPKEENDSGERQDANTELQPLSRPVKADRWKGRFLREEILRRPIRPLRPPRPPPKYACPPESPNRSLGSPGATQKEPRIAIHPLHLISKKPTREPVWDSPLEELPPLRQSSNFDETTQMDSGPENRIALLHVLAETHSTSEAWDAYNALLAAHRPRRSVTSHKKDATHLGNRCEAPVIPYAHLHRLARLLSSSHPRTRDLFLRLLSVLTTIRTSGGTIFIWEWNALIDCAGKGWRKTNIEDYRAAVSVFKDMVTSGRTASSPAPLPGDIPSESRVLSADGRPIAQPDIITFTTLLDIASRTHSESAIIHAMSLLEASALPWNNVTHMARLQYFIHSNQLDAVKDILRNTVHQGLDLYTLNGCLWAFAQSGRLRVALQVYELMRRNIPADERSDLDPPPTICASSDLENVPQSRSERENPILNVLGFVLPAAIQPDTVTYTLLIQALCYHGDLIGALAVFRDMVSTIDPASRSPSQYHAFGRPSATSSFHKPSLPIYRALFLGFARHAHKRPSLSSSLISRRRHIDTVPLPEFAARLTASSSGDAAQSPSPQEMDVDMPWTLKNLDILFESFLEMDWDGGAVYEDDVRTTASRPSDRMIYWIMVAYAKTTKRDVGKMYKVWRELDTRFGNGEDGVSLWGGRLARIADTLAKGYR